MWVDKGNIQDALRRLYARCYVRGDRERGALGQLAKKVNVSDNSVDFLSKAIVKSINGFTVGRDPIRALVSGRFTNSTKITDDVHRDARSYSISSWGSQFQIFDQFIPKSVNHP